jgi:hypothetical protein
MFGSIIHDLDDTQPKQMSLLDSFLDRVKVFDPFPVLYSRTSTGAVQTWKVEVVGNKYRFHTGQKGGAIIVSDWTVCQGKNVGRANETAGDQQALKEAKAAQQKKLKSGGYWENEADIDKVRFFEPMLAYKLRDYRNSVNYPLMVDRKYNGGRVVTNRDGIKTRKGETYQTLPHLSRVLAPLFQQFPNLVLDGEGYNHDLRHKLNECMSLLRKTKNASPEDITKAEQIIRYYVYDGYGFTVNGEEITKEEEEKQIKIITDQYNEQTTPYYAASRLWVDGVIDPIETRKAISIGIEAANQAPITKKFNVGIIQT